MFQPFDIRSTLLISLYLALGLPVLINTPSQAKVPGRTSSGVSIAQQGGASGQTLPRIDAHEAGASDPTLDQIRNQSEETMGTIFVEPDQVKVKAPLLRALIQLNANLSPYQLDADSQTPIDLRDALKTALENNLPLKISKSDQESNKWLFYSSLGGFLPDLVNGLSFQKLSGKFASPFGVVAAVDSPYLVVPNSLSYNFFKGGSILFGALQNKHKYKASRYALKGATNDVLYEVANLYYQLVLNDVLLQVRVKAVQTSEALLKRNQIQYDNGANTKLDVLQAKTQLSKDRQQLITQQITRRQSAVNLATALNLDTAVDLVLKDRLVAKIRLVDPTLPPGSLLRIAIENRPELKKYEQLRLAARDAVKVARAPLFPTIVGNVGGATTAANITKSIVTSQSAATAGSLALGGFGPSAVVPVGNASGQKRFTATELFLIGVDLQWKLGGLGVTDLAKVKSAQWLARKAKSEFDLELAKVYQEVRNTYLDSLAAENLIDETTSTVNSAKEQLDVATTRIDEGVGTDLEVVIAQRDYTSALVDKANAIVKFNVAQANLLRSLGRISLDTLTSANPLRY